jgi:hypothetical protein
MCLSDDMSELNHNKKVDPTGIIVKASVKRYPKNVSFLFSELRIIGRTPWSYPRNHPFYDMY